MLKVVSASARAVWNGPFFIGKLTRPVTLGEVAMKVLETLWRGGVLIALLVAGTVAAIAAGEAWPEEKSLAAQIVGTADLADPQCNGAYPLHIAFKNNSKERVGRVAFRLAVYEQYRTTNLAAYPTDDIVSDAIIPAGRTSHQCLQAPSLIEPRDLKGLTFAVTVDEAESTNLPEPPVGPLPQPKSR